MGARSLLARLMNFTPPKPPTRLSAAEAVALVAADPAVRR